MAEEKLSENNEIQPAAQDAAESETAIEQSAPVENAESTEAAPEVVEAVASEEEPAAEEQEEQPSQIIIEKERGFAYYVGFAMLTVLSFVFYFFPGIAVTFGVSRLVELNPAAAWIFSAILSVIIWLLFKMKISGFIKSFRIYIGFCAVVLVGMIALEVATEEYAVFAEIFKLLVGVK